MSPPSTSLPDRTINNVLQVLFGAFAEAESKDFSGPVDDSVSAEDYNYHSDSDLEDGDGAADTEERLKETISPKGYPSDPPCSSLGDNKSTRTYGERKERPKEGKVIKIRDIAFITYVF